MKTNLPKILILCSLLAGCVHQPCNYMNYPNYNPSRTPWDDRIDEIDASYQKKEITKAEWLKLRTDADAQRMQYLQQEAMQRQRAQLYMIDSFQNSMNSIHWQ